MTRNPPPKGVVRLQERFTDLVRCSHLDQLIHSAVRHLPAWDQDDRVAEGLAVAWRAFLNKATRTGVLLEARHLLWIARRHARDTRLRLVGGDDTDCCLAPPQLTWRHCYRPTSTDSPETALMVREDVRRYLAVAEPDERQLLAAHAEGHTLAELGHLFGISRSAALRRLQTLSVLLHRRVQRRRRAHG